MEHADAILDGGLGGYTLYGLNNYLLGLLIGVELSFVHNLIDISSCIEFGLVLEAFDKTALCLVSAEPRNLLELNTLLILHLNKFRLLLQEHFLIVVDMFLLTVDLLLAADKILMFLIQSNLLLFQTVLIGLNFLITLLGLFLELTLLIEEFLLNFEEFLLFDYVSILFGLLHHFFIFPSDDILENCESDATANILIHRFHSSFNASSISEVR